MPPAMTTNSMWKTRESRSAATASAPAVVPVVAQALTVMPVQQISGDATVVGVAVCEAQPHTNRVVAAALAAEPVPSATKLVILRAPYTVPVPVPLLLSRPSS